MKTSKQCVWWLIAAVVFCLVVSAGCGGSSNNDNAPAAQDEESGGRETIGDWEDLGFELLSGTWQIDSTEMILGNGVRLETEPTRLPFTMNATSAGYLSFTDLFGQTASSYWQVAQGDGVQEYYVIELSKAELQTYDSSAQAHGGQP